MDHIKNTLNNSGLLRNLRDRMKKNSQVSGEVLSLLSPAQRDQVVSATFQKGRYIVRLKSAYVIPGVRHALRNLHHPVQIFVAK